MDTGLSICSEAVKKQRRKNLMNLKNLTILILWMQ